MGTPLGDEPVRPDDCADVVNGPCISSTPDQATCIAQGMSLALEPARRMHVARDMELD